MKKWSTFRLLAAGIILVVVSIAIVLFVSIRQAASVKDTSLRIDHTQTVLRNIQKLEQASLSNESGARGYVITGIDSFLAPFLASEKTITEALHSLDLLIRDNPGQQQKLREMERLLQSRMDFSHTMIGVRKKKGLSEVVELAETGRGRNLMDSIHQLCGQMIEQEEALLAERREKNNLSTRQLNLFLYSMLGLVLLLSLIAIRQIKRRMTEQEATEKKFATLLDAAPDATVIVDRNGIIRMVNQQVINLFGYDRTEITGQQVEVLVPDSARGAHARHRDQFFHSPKVRDMGVGLELHAVKKDGNLFPVEISLSPIRMEEGWWVSASVRDITRRKKLENTLKTANEELEAFTYSVSHDLRAPLRGIIGFTTILEEEYAEKLDEEARRITGIIRDNTHKMGHLVDDLLTFSRTGRQELVKVPMEMDSVVKEVVQQARQQYPRTPVSISVQPLPGVRADKNMIRQVWINLVSNAIKYAGNKPEVSITIGSYRSDKDIVCYIKDNGIGFDNKYREKLFRVFQRLHSADEFEGTGVGLALVEKIISRHGGKVWAEGAVDQGACFYFSLPD